jgi:RNA recognition motif-containing protein
MLDGLDRHQPPIPSPPVLPTEGSRAVRELRRPENHDVKIFVGNLSFQATEDSVRSLFSQHGDVSEVAVVTDRDTGRPRGFAFVTMPNGQEAQAAIDSVNGTELDGRTLNVNEARERTGGGGGGGGRGGRRW